MFDSSTSSLSNSYHWWLWNAQLQHVTSPVRIYFCLLIPGKKTKQNCKGYIIDAACLLGIPKLFVFFLHFYSQARSDIIHFSNNQWICLLTCLLGPQVVAVGPTAASGRFPGGGWRKWWRAAAAVSAGEHSPETAGTRCSTRRPAGRKKWSCGRTIKWKTIINSGVWLC